MRVQLVDLLHVFDNYGWLIIDEAAGVAAIVDPADPDTVAEAVTDAGVTLTHALCTHHHWDHAGGNAKLKARFPDVQIVGYGPDAHRIPAIDREVAGGERVEIGGLIAEVLVVPCHTRGHVAYLFRDAEDGDALFCGDTLFIAGCGRFFEGDAAQMDHALNTVLGGLADDTRVYCGHEYTVGNLTFAAHVEPDNDAIAAKLAWARAERAAGRPTVPGPLGAEKQHNPFMRVREPAVQRAMGTEGDPIATMKALREAKNRFKG